MSKKTKNIEKSSMVCTNNQFHFANQKSFLPEMCMIYSNGTPSTLTSTHVNQPETSNSANLHLLDIAS